MQLLWTLLLSTTLWGGEHVVWSGAGPLHLGAPSRDGRFLSGVDPASGALILRDLASGAIRNLTGTPAPGEFAYFSVVARDGKQVAYAWFNAEGFYELRVIDTGGGEPKVLYANPEAGFVQPCAWSPDAQFILTLLFRADNVSQIALVPVEGGAPRVLKTLNWVYPNKMDLSPDGAYVVYDNFSGDGATERDIFALAVDGSREMRVVAGPSNDVFPAFTPDGREMVFLSDRGGVTGVWSQPFPKGEPRQVLANAGRALAMGITGDRTFYYARREGGTDIEVVDVDWAAGKAGKPTRVGAATAAANSAPAWSPDGSLLAWLTRVGTENFGRDAHAVTVSDGRDDRLISPKLAQCDRIRWTRDGSGLLLEGADRHGRDGVFRVDPANGQVERVADPGAAALRGGLAAYHESGRVYVASHGKGDPRLLATVRNGIIDSLDWLPGGEALLMGTGGRTRRLWRVSLEGGSPQPLSIAGSRTGPASVNPVDGRLAYVVGSEWTEVRAFRLPAKQ